MPEIQIEGQPAPGFATPGNLVGADLAQLQAIESGSSTNTGTPSNNLMIPWMAQHSARSTGSSSLQPSPGNNMSAVQNFVSALTTMTQRYGSVDASRNGYYRYQPIADKRYDFEGNFQDITGQRQIGSSGNRFMSEMGERSVRGDRYGAVYAGGIFYPANESIADKRYDFEGNFQDITGQRQIGSQSRGSATTAGDFVSALITPIPGAPATSLGGMIRDMDAAEHDVANSIGGRVWSRTWNTVQGGPVPPWVTSAAQAAAITMPSPPGGWGAGWAGGGGGTGRWPGGGWVGSPDTAIPFPPGGWGGGGGGGPPGGDGGGAGGPGGGGGGGAGAAGGGPGGPGGVHIAGMLGLGSTSRMITAGLGTAMAARVAEELFFLPQSFGGAEASALGNAAPYRDLTYGSYALGRAGGFSGQGLRDSIYTGVKPPEWMETLGLGPTESLGMLQNFGIVQRDNDANKELIQGLGRTRFTNAFSGLNMEGSIGQAAHYGMISGDATGITQYTTQLAPILSMAVEQGLDRASILRSIDASVATTMRGGGVGADIGGIGRFVSGFSMVPGGRTGEFGASVLQNLNAANESVGTDSTRSLVYTMAASTTLNTPAKLKAFLEQGGRDGAYEKLANDPTGKKQLQYYFENIQAGRPQFAAQYLRDIIGGGNFPEAESSLLTGPYNPLLKQLPENLQPLATGVTNLNSTQYISNQQRATTAASRGRTMPWSGRASMIHDLYKEAGLSEPAIAGMMSYMKNESGFNPYVKNMGGGGQGAHGLLQLRGDRLTAYRTKYGHDPDDVMIPADVLQREAVEWSMLELSGKTGDKGATEAGRRLKAVGTPAEAADIVSDLYGRGQYTPGQRADRESDAEMYRVNYANDAATGPADNIPSDALKAQADALAGTMKGSEITFGEMNVIIPAVNQSLRDLAAAAAYVTKVMRSMPGPLPGAPGLGDIVPPP